MRVIKKILEQHEHMKPSWIFLAVFRITVPIPIPPDDFGLIPLIPSKTPCPQGADKCGRTGRSLSLVLGFDFPFLGFRWSKHRVFRGGLKHRVVLPSLPDIYQGLEVDVGSRVCLMMNSRGGSFVLKEKRKGKKRS